MDPSYMLSIPLQLALGILSFVHTYAGRYKTASSSTTTTSTSSTNLTTLPPELIIHVLSFLLPNRQGRNERREGWKAIGGFVSSNKKMRELGLQVWFRSFRFDGGNLGPRLLEELVRLEGMGMGERVRELTYTAPLSTTPMHMRTPNLLPSLQSLVILPSTSYGSFIRRPKLLGLPTSLLVALGSTRLRALHLPIGSFGDIRDMAKTPTHVMQGLRELILFRADDHCGEDGGCFGRMMDVRFPLSSSGCEDVNALATHLLALKTPFPSLTSLSLPHTLLPSSILGHHFRSCHKSISSSFVSQTHKGACKTCFAKYGSASAESERTLSLLLREGCVSSNDGMRMEGWENLRRVEWGYWFVRGGDCSKEGRSVVRLGNVNGSGCGCVMRERDEEEREWIATN